ncbi:23S rRNA (uracil(1939)-C(5))-methyltransferase RlmD [Sulfurivermis fontis]|uniref:23S rRNA (uracil(1939)-C(5))-methyltransferase RlmD n=1 Tax=Sulfurivermis fontis TaxID=1972068 RepID=UPI000FDA8E93|nr:23S rRNA (uracil(1939)-C(5))-methyltransferase RlmD [Sulfurivermis fontis]
MSRRKKKPLPTTPVRVTIESLNHEGRGVGRVDGKTVFVAGALPGEEVEFTYSAIHRNFDEGDAVNIITASPERVAPRCPHFSVCGGCAMQHLAPDAQIAYKQKVLLDDFRHIGKVQPQEVLPPLRGPHWGYRRKARLGVKYVPKKGKVLVGFRERSSPFLAELTRCEVLHPSVGERIEALGAMIGTLSVRDKIAQIEVAVDDTQTALALRNLVELSDEDKARFKAFAIEHNIHIYLQPGGADSLQPLWPEQIQLRYVLDNYDVSFGFKPGDFTQVNTDINRQMIDRAIAMLELTPEDRVLDLFCGLGNFTLPLARRCREVVGVEGETKLVERARVNATENQLGNVQFHAADLAGDLEHSPWWKQGFDKVLLDPPRLGAQETLAHIARMKVGRIVYVSCNPATLARDAGILVNEYGYRLVQAGVMDMFPHTAHVESIALFVRGKK